MPTIACLTVISTTWRASIEALRRCWWALAAPRVCYTTTSTISRDNHPSHPPPLSADTGSWGRLSGYTTHTSILGQLTNPRDDHDHIGPHNITNIIALASSIDINIYLRSIARTITCIMHGRVRHPLKHSLTTLLSVGRCRYSGISLGWGWDSFHYSFDGANRVEGNHIHHHMQVLGDGGAMCVSPMQPYRTTSLCATGA